MKTRKHINYKLVILIILSIFSIAFVYNDYFLYKTSILKINNIENVYEEDSEFYTQKITGVIKNGKYKDNIITYENKSSYSGVYDEQIHDKSELLLELDSTGKEVIRFVGIKRDKYLVVLIILFINLLLIVTRFKGLKTLFTLFINILISIFSVLLFNQYRTNMNMLLLYIFVSLIFIILSLYIPNGKSKKTLAAILSSIISLFVSFSFSVILIKLFGSDLSIWNMEYMEIVYDYKNFFYVNILLCGLGAIMDIAITISSSLNELIVKNPRISKSSLLKSGKEISKDIIGTMSNVMLYTCFTPIIPTIFLAMRNGVILSRAFSLYGILDLVIVLCSAISIVLSIPISLYVSVLILKGKGGVK